MAKVTIIFEDADDAGTVHTSVDFDPPAEAGDILTSAQAAAMACLAWIQEKPANV